METGFTQQALLVQCRANEVAAQYENKVGPPHILAAILEAKESGGYRLLDQLTDVAQLKSEIELAISAGPVSAAAEYKNPSKRKLPISQNTKDAMEAAYQTVMQRDGCWTTVDMVGGIVRAANTDSATLLADHGIDSEALEEHLATDGLYPET